jgi:hypothetical protein
MNNNKIVSPGRGFFFVVNYLTTKKGLANPIKGFLRMLFKNSPYLEK